MFIVVCLLLLVLAIVMVFTIHSSKNDICVSCVMILAGLAVLLLSLTFFSDIALWLRPVLGGMYLVFFVVLGIRRYWFTWGKIIVSATATLVWLAPVLKEVIRI